MVRNAAPTLKRKKEAKELNLHQKRSSKRCRSDWQNKTQLKTKKFKWYGKIKIKMNQEVKLQTQTEKPNHYT